MSAVTPEARAVLRANAEAATPGPWWVEAGRQVTATVLGVDIELCALGDDVNAAHIAGMDPATTIALIDALDQADDLATDLATADRTIAFTMQERDAALDAVADLRARIIDLANHLEGRKTPADTDEYGRRLRALVDDQEAT